MIHVLPRRAFGANDGVWEFLDQAIRMKKNWLSRKYRDAADGQKANHANNEAEGLLSNVNPYRSSIGQFLDKVLLGFLALEW